MTQLLKIENLLPANKGNNGHDRRAYVYILQPFNNNGDVSNCMKYFQSERLIINESTNNVYTYL